MKKISVLIPDGDDDRALVVVRNLAYSGKTRIHVLASKGRNVLFSRHCKSHVLKADEKNVDGRLNRVIAISEKYNIEILLPIGEMGTKFVQLKASILRSRFRIPPTPDIDLLNLVSDKWLLHEFAKKETFLYPNSYKIESFEQNELKEISFPVLLKPRIGAGGIGIKYIETHEKLYNILGSSNGAKLWDDYIIQEYQPGLGMDLSVLCLNGEILAYTMQRSSDEETHTFAFAKIIDLINHNKLLETGKQILSALNWSGVAHIDFIHDSETDQFYMIDFNPRFWGTLTGSVFAGVNFPYLSCLAAKGDRFALPEFKKMRFAILKEKSLLPWMLGRNGYNGIPFSSTNLKFVLTDPLPALNY